MTDHAFDFDKRTWKLILIDFQNCDTPSYYQCLCLCVCEYICHSEVKKISKTLERTSFRYTSAITKTRS